MKIMIVVTHLLGTGHLSRALTLSRAFKAAGDTVCLVSGGTVAPMLPYDGIDLVQLPPVKSDGVNFSQLLNSDGNPASSDLFNMRKRMLGEAFSQFEPDVLITELFPFGRRILRTEFKELLEQARNADHPPLICASIRDILAPPSKPKKAEYADEMIATFYDAVLVHSDHALTPLDLSWPVSQTLAPKLHYTGFVAPQIAAPHPTGLGKDEIIISAGGGDSGTHVYDAALAAAHLIDRHIRVLIGGSQPQERINDLRSRAPENVSIEAARKDFRQMLRHAAASVSLCGYNTALDILQAGTPAVFIPFDEGNEVEQGIRAEALTRQSGIAALFRADLTPQSLCDALSSVIAAPKRDLDPVQFCGAAQTVEIVRKLRQQI